VCRLRRLYDPAGYRASWEEDRAGRRGCLQNKRELIPILEDALGPLRARRRALEQRPDYVRVVLQEGAHRARAIAAETMESVRAAMGL
jgi:tryptophanyl-tRNA synthetase